MEFDFVYANYKTTVTIKTDNGGVLGKITDSELSKLQALFYLTLTTFIQCRTHDYIDEFHKDKTKDTEHKEG